MQQSHSLKAQSHRRKAATCGRLAAWARSSPDREKLLRLREAHETLAFKEELLGGLPPIPPGNASAIAAQRSC